MLILQDFVRPAQSEPIDWELVAHTDELSTIPNRRALDRHLARLESLESEVSLAVIDFDFFKQINDTLGHSEGDRVLKKVALALLESVLALGDESAMCTRFGGDEFVIVSAIAPDKLGELALNAVHSAGYKASIGCAFGLAGKALFDRADAATFKAKAGGRDRVVVDC
jgi:diguanylate cyclase (GGDEF)-like protein